MSALIEIGVDPAGTQVTIDIEELLATRLLVQGNSGSGKSHLLRRLSLGAMTNLMCRGRKRGLAGIVATQRLAKLAKNVAAEASNFLMGRTFLDIDMARAADLLGMERRNADAIRDLGRGHFLGLGPAISRRPIAIKIGSVQSSSQAMSHALTPPPISSAEELQALLYDEAGPAKAMAVPMAPVAAVTADELIDRIESAAVIIAAPDDDRPIGATDSNSTEAVHSQIFAAMVAEQGATFRSWAALYQDFSLRCRTQRVSTLGIDIAQFRRHFAFAIAGISEPTDSAWAGLVEAASDVPEELLAPFLILARAAQQNAPCPEDEELGRVYGTNSPGRIRRLLDHLEKAGSIVVRTDFSGRRTISIPQLGMSTAP